MESCRLEIRLKPRAKTDRVRVAENGMIDIAVTSPPVDEKANEHLLKLLAKKLGVPKSSLSLLRGGHSRNKVVAVEGMSAGAMIRMLASNPSQPM